MCADVPVNVTNAGYKYGTTVQLDYQIKAANINGSAANISYLCSIKDMSGGTVLDAFVCSDKAPFVGFQFAAPSAGDYSFLVTSSVTNVTGAPVSLCAPVAFSVVS